jgi:transposase
MKRARLRYDRAFKISVVEELESGKPPSQIVREHSIHPSLPSRGAVQAAVPSWSGKSSSERLIP